MITVYLAGVDPYMGSQFSEEHQKKLARIFKIHEEELIFQISDSHLYHKGVDQISYQAIFRVFAPSNFHEAEKEAARYLLSSLKDIVIHVQVEFHYFDSVGVYESVDDNYPRFITEANKVGINAVSGSDDDEIFQGNIFKEVEKKLKKEVGYTEGASCHDGICEGEEDEEGPEEEEE